MTGTTLLSRIDAVLNKVSASDTVAYKRAYSRTGGDSLLGVGGTLSSVDTALSPKPAIFTVNQQDLLSLSGATKVQLNDQMMIVSVSALTRADLSNKEVTVVLKRGAVEEEYGIESYTVAPFDGRAIAFTVLLRSKRRP